MVVEEKVQAVLIAAAGVTALVPASKIKVGFMGQLIARPYISHRPISLEPTHTYEALQNLRKWDFYQVSCFTDERAPTSVGEVVGYPLVRAIANAVRAALGSYLQGGIQSRLRNEDYFYEEDVRIHQIAVQFDIGESL